MIAIFARPPTNRADQIARVGIISDHEYSAAAQVDRSLVRSAFALPCAIWIASVVNVASMSASRMPAFFFGHGNPMHAIQDNEYTQAWNRIGNSLPPPKAIVAVSAHWYLPGTLVTAMERPRTIHDFGGFPRPLYEVQYPAAGDPALARRIQSLLGPAVVELDHQWGLDHGTWSVLVHVYPKADVPIVQVSIDETQPARVHYELGRRLAPLRDEGVLVIGSGNLVHNLHTYAWGRHVQEPYDWAVRFEARARELMMAGEHEPLIDYEALGRDAMLSAPTPDHYLPLLYVLGLQQKDEKVSFPIDGVDGGSISMLTVAIGYGTPEDR